MHVKKQLNTILLHRVNLNSSNRLKTYWFSRDLLYIKINEKLAVQNICEIGRELLFIKSRVPYRRFMLVVEKLLGYTPSMCRNYMNVYERFGANSAIIAEITMLPTVLYALAAPSVPDEVVNKAIEKASTGEKVTVKDVKQIREEVKAELIQKYEDELNQKDSKVESLQRQLREQPKEVTKTVEPDDYQELKELESKVGAVAELTTKAKSYAAKLIAEADKKSANMISDAKQKAEEIMDGAQRQVTKINQEINNIKAAKDKTINQKMEEIDKLETQKTKLDAAIEYQRNLSREVREKEGRFIYRDKMKMNCLLYQTHLTKSDFGTVCEDEVNEFENIVWMMQEIIKTIQSKLVPQNVLIGELV